MRGKSGSRPLRTDQPQTLREPGAPFPQRGILKVAPPPAPTAPTLSLRTNNQGRSINMMPIRGYQCGFEDVQVLSHEDANRTLQVGMEVSRKCGRQSVDLDSGAVALRTPLAPGLLDLTLPLSFLLYTEARLGDL